MKKLLFFIALTLLAMGGENNQTQDCNATAHHSCIKTNNGHLFYDDALVGTWQLEEQTLVTPNGSKKSRFFGHKLIFRDDNTYIEDYSSETSEPLSINSPQGTIVNTYVGSGSVEGIYSVGKNINSYAFLKIIKLGGTTLKIIHHSSTGYNKTTKLPPSFPLCIGKPQSDASLNNYVKVDYFIHKNLGILTTKAIMPTGVKIIGKYKLISH
jgi:hypothetical protein